MKEDVCCILAFVPPAVFQSPLQQKHRDLMSLQRSSPQGQLTNPYTVLLQLENDTSAKPYKEVFLTKWKGGKHLSELPGQEVKSCLDEYLPSLQLNEFTESRKHYKGTKMSFGAERLENTHRYRRGDVLARNGSQ